MSLLIIPRLQRNLQLDTLPLSTSCSSCSLSSQSTLNLQEFSEEIFYDDELIRIKMLSFAYKLKLKTDTIWHFYAYYYKIRNYYRIDQISQRKLQEWAITSILIASKLFQSFSFQIIQAQIHFQFFQSFKYSDCQFQMLQILNYDLYPSLNLSYIFKQQDSLLITVCEILICFQQRLLYNRKQLQKLLKFWSDENDEQQICINNNSTYLMVKRKELEQIKNKISY